ncbi:hypothetical protein [Enorma phocaeensis]|uniref:hypothetical protein n=1 Tax=Enorma phocaeensis TaxID=1871019 RepID=UPI000C8216A7|nr:hypothetical protein [Enorma phocaeensis]
MSGTSCWRRSGIEFFWDLCHELGYDEALSNVEQAFRPGRTREYWTGWTTAYLQWRCALTFRLVFDVLPYNVLVDLRRPWHEASEERVARLACALHRRVEDLLEPVTPVA